MTVPASVKVGPYTYSLVPCDTLLETGAVGDTCVRRARIRYYVEQAPEMLRSTVLHEIMHACANLGGSEDGSEDAFTEEQWIRRIEGALFGVLRDNPELVAYLMEPTA
jgi:hypothetical protein